MQRLGATGVPGSFFDRFSPLRLTPDGRIAYGHAIEYRVPIYDPDGTLRQIVERG